MHHGLLWVVQGGIVLFVASAIAALWSHFTQRKEVERLALLITTIAGPVTLAVCWYTQLQFREEDTLLWSRLMSGHEGPLFRIGTVGIIAGSSLAVGALSLREGFRALLAGAVFMMSMWYIVYLHPTPHYVPMSSTQDKIIWFALLVGGAAFCIFIYHKLRPYLQWAITPLMIGAVLVSCLAAVSVGSFQLSQQPLQLSGLEPREQIQAAGCLSCHTLGEQGVVNPGGGLESVASRKEDVVQAFLADPSMENAKKFGIRENPTGEMKNVRLTPEEVDQLTEAMKALFAIQPPSMLGPGMEHIEAVLTEKTCLACHTVMGQGAPGGGLGGPLENGQKLSREVLVQWLKDPSFMNAMNLGIRKEPMGAMTPFPLNDEQAPIIADWILSLKPAEGLVEEATQ